VAEKNGKKTWTTKDSAKLYNLKGWGSGYFGVSDEGHLSVHPRRNNKRVMDMRRIVDDIKARGISMPLLIRFQDILRDRVATLNKAFRKAIKQYEYKGQYMGAYPIKVNQLREVVEEVLDAGQTYRHGLEAGSKPELMAVLALNNPGALAIVNGYKDAAIMDLACMGWKMGREIVVVIEKLSELPLLLKSCDKAGVRPMVGLRAKLQSEGSGRWKSSAGMRAKFGLTTPEVIEAIEILKGRDMLDCASLLHFHIGSQVTDISVLHEAVKEAARTYAKLRALGAEIQYIDCGGGLGVDYEGSNSSRDHSVNYSLDEYARDVVYTVQEVCAQEGVPEPGIVTESGRFLTAHHAVLLVETFGSIETGSSDPIPEKSKSENKVVEDMREVIDTATVENIAESYHDGQKLLEDADNLFRLGYMGLEDKAKMETLYWELCRKIRALTPEAESVPDDIRAMTRSLEDQYLVNFSLFQSLPDVWALQQIFPVVPLQRLEEEPKRWASLADITCDSDGKMDLFIYDSIQRNALPIHDLDGDPYYLGIFLMGAYQATMGDIHNLFGRVNEVHVFQDSEEPGGYYIEEIIKGQTVRDVLTSIQYSPYDLVKQVKAVLDARVKSGKLKPREGVEIIKRYEALLDSYTYLDPEGSGMRGVPQNGSRPVEDVSAA